MPWVATMKKNEHYFPTMEFVKEKVGSGLVANGWVRRGFGEEGVGEGVGGVVGAGEVGSEGITAGGDGDM